MKQTLYSVNVLIHIWFWFRKKTIVNCHDAWFKNNNKKAREKIPIRLLTILSSGFIRTFHVPRTCNLFVMFITFVENVYFVLSAVGLSFVNDVSDEVVGRALGVLDLHLRLEHVAELDAADREVDDRGVLFDVERVLREPNDINIFMNRETGR